jgi:acyl-CoA dehydrogenase
MYESFNQAPPRLENQYSGDRVLRSYLRRTLPPDVLEQVEPSLQEMGRLAGGPLYQLQLADRLHEPQLTQWDAWGERVDRIELTPLWQEAERLAAASGVVAAAYEGRFGPFARPYQFALAYLFHASTDIYTCPLAMTDGAARTLLHSGNWALIERAVPHLTSRDPRQFWTSGQWMTESTRGSDVGRAETLAREDPGEREPGVSTVESGLPPRRLPRSRWCLPARRAIPPEEVGWPCFTSRRGMRAAIYATSGSIA